jgi:hypothetical protein
MRKIILILLLLTSCLVNLNAQDMLGTWGSNYGGVNAAIQNPALIANSKLYMDINLVGAAFGYYHNDFYLEEPDSYVYDHLHSPKYNLKTQAKLTDYYKKNPPEFEKGFVSAREMGPAFMVNNGRNSFALSFSVRETASITGVADVIGKLTKEASADSSIIKHGTFDFNQPIRAAGLAWGETAFTFARVLKSNTRDIMTLGVTLKYLTGFSGSYIYIDNAGFRMTGKNQLTITNSDVSLGVSMPFRYDNPLKQISFDHAYKFGKGFSTDLGFTIQRNTDQHFTQRFNRLCEQEFDQYDYRISVALLDLGYITFKDNAISGKLLNTNPISYNFQNAKYTNTNDLIDTVNHYYNPNDSSLRKKKFTVATPTALSFQYDKRITDNIYVTAAGIIGLPISKNAVQRPFQLAIIPRYESYLFEVSLPVSLYEFAKPRIGFSARVLFLTVGTDRLISLSGKHEYYGYDYYASIRLNFMKLFRLQFIKGQCRESLAHPCF